MEPIITSKAPFRRIPISMPRRRIVYLDARRLSSEIAGTAFERLNNLLTYITEVRHDSLKGTTKQQSDPLADKAVPAILDAYSIIDSVHRFRGGQGHIFDL